MRALTTPGMGSPGPDVRFKLFVGMHG